MVSEAGIWPREADFRSLSQPAISPPATSSTPILPSIKEKGAAAMALGTPGSARDAVVTAGLLPNLYKSDLGSEALLRLLEQRLSEAPDVPTLLATCARSLPRLSPGLSPARARLAEATIENKELFTKIKRLT